MISVAILTKNEEKNILDCLESVLWADEVVIVDDFSEDRTAEVAKSLSSNKKIKIFQKKLENDFSSQRNYALSKTKYDWVLFVDADEIVSKQLRQEINDLLIDNSDKINGYFIKRQDFMWGKKINHGEIGDIKLLRLAKKNAGDWKGKVHEQWIIEGKASELNNALLHYPHQNISEFLKKINFYTTIRANELFGSKVQTSLLEVMVYPKAKFLVNYFIKLGFLDGMEGLIIAILMSFHSFLVRGKLWLLWKKK